MGGSLASLGIHEYTSLSCKNSSLARYTSGRFGVEEWKHMQDSTSTTLKYGGTSLMGLFCFHWSCDPF
jgi:hypothetical protein